MAPPYALVRYFVTGGSGFIGRPLVGALAEKGAVTVLVEPGRETRFPAGVETVSGSLSERSSLSAAADSDIVYHLAAQSNPRLAAVDPVKSCDVNTGGALRVLAACTGRGTKLVFPSTAHVYGRTGHAAVAEKMQIAPTSVYAASKAAAELLIQAAAPGQGVDFVILRIFNAYGPGQNPDFVVARLVGQLLADGRAVLRCSAPVRDFVFVDDVVQALLLAGHKTTTSAPIVNVGTGRPTTIGELAALAAAEAGVPGQVAFEMTALPPDDLPLLVADSTVARETLGWQPAVSLEAGLRLTLENERRSRSMKQAY